MKYSLFVSLVGIILFANDVKANFTKQVCINCCQGLQENSTECIVECHVKFSQRQEFNSQRDCNNACRVALAGCRQLCLYDCAMRYEYIPDGFRAPQKRERERVKARKASEFLGMRVHRTTPRDFNSPKPKQKRRKKNQTEEPPVWKSIE